MYTHITYEGVGLRAVRGAAAQGRPGADHGYI